MAEPRTAQHTLIMNAAEGQLQFMLVRRQEDAAAPEILCSQVWHAPSQGAELLTPALQAALHQLALSPTNINRIACVRGPGSFTGLRLVIATAAGLARAVGALQAGIDYLPLLAASAASRIFPAVKPPSSIWVLTHARKQLVHMQGFSLMREAADEKESPWLGEDDRLLPLTGILVCSPEQAVTIIQEKTEKYEDVGCPVLLGSGLTKNRQAIAGLFGLPSGAVTRKNATEPAGAEKNAAGAVLLPACYDQPDMEALLHAAEKADYSPDDVPPKYARPSDAEENLENIASSLGLDPSKAREKLARLTGNTVIDG